MIKGIHGLFYTSQAEELRAFLRDKLGLPAYDAGGGWLINDFTEADMGCHPIDFPNAPPSGTHAVSFYCDDIQQTVAELRNRGVTFDDEIADHGYGWVIHLTMPGGVKVDLYQPKYKPSTKGE